MERGRHHFNPFEEIDALAAERNFGEDYVEAIRQMAHSAERVEPTLQFDWLSRLFLAARQANQSVRLGLRSDIIKQALTVPGIAQRPEVVLELHHLRLGALAEDYDDLVFGRTTITEASQTVVSVNAEIDQTVVAIYDLTEADPFHPYRSYAQNLVRGLISRTDDVG